MSNKNILMIVQDFPPPISGGNMRCFKNVKYFSEAGMNVFVLCRASNKHRQLKKNELVANQIGRTRVYSVADIKSKLFGSNQESGLLPKTGKRSNRSRLISFLFVRPIKFVIKYLVSDIARYTWVPSAFGLAVKLIKKHKITTVISSSPPASTQVLGLAIKKRFGKSISWISDYRDLWSQSHVYQLGLSKNKCGNQKLERKAIINADRVIFVSEGIRNLTIEKLDLNPEICRKLSVLTNGFDEDDFASLQHAQLGFKSVFGSNSSLSYLYAGTLLGPMIHNSVHLGFLNYIRAMRKPMIKLNLLGRFESEFIDRFVEIRHSVEVHGSVSHQQAIAEMSNSDVLVLVLTNDQEGRIAFTGKFFEYLRVGKPILALVPDGEVSAIIKRYDLGEVANPDDESAILSAIVAINEGLSTGRFTQKHRRDYLTAFDRRVIAAQFLELIDANSIVENV